MKRDIDGHLHRWKKDPRRKVLLIRGTRQVGKTYSVRQLGQSFAHFIEANSDRDPEIAIFFERSLDPKKICEKLALYYNRPIIPGETLLFLDEIQSCPKAIESLRFFFEGMPDLHSVAAGSLLEFALADIPTFGVGRIQSLFMYPMTFAETLAAGGEDNLAAMIAAASPRDPVDSVLHDRLIEQFRMVQILGGMPEVIQAYLSGVPVHSCQEIIDTILTAYRDDFAKYARRVPAARLTEVYRSCIHQAGQKFKYSEVGESHTETYKDALFLLERAGLFHRVTHCSANGLPLGAELNPKRFKIIPHDSGLYQRSLGLDLADAITADAKAMINRGSLAEIRVGCELVAHQPHSAHPDLFYWHREARASNAEVDYVIARGDRILPMEVKAGSRGQMKSLHLFLAEKKLPLGIRICAENFSRYDKILTLPIYAVKTLFTNPEVLQTG